MTDIRLGGSTNGLMTSELNNHKSRAHCGSDTENTAAQAAAEAAPGLQELLLLLKTFTGTSWPSLRLLQVLP